MTIPYRAIKVPLAYNQPATLGWIGSEGQWIPDDPTEPDFLGCFFPLKANDDTPTIPPSAAPPEEPV